MVRVSLPGCEGQALTQVLLASCQDVAVQQVGCGADTYERLSITEPVWPAGQAPWRNSAEGCGPQDDTQVLLVWAQGPGAQHVGYAAEEYVRVSVIEPI